MMMIIIIIIIMFFFQSAVTLLTVSDPSHRRKVSIEMYSSAAAGKRHKGKTSSLNNLDLVSRSSGNLPRHNLSTSMTLLDVREGTFTAQIPLNSLSTTADVTVKFRRHRQGH